MLGQFESPRNQNSEAFSTIEKRVRPDGIPYVELVTKTGKYSIVLRNGAPYITSSSDTMDFRKLSPADQKLVEDTFLEQE